MTMPPGMPAPLKWSEPDPAYAAMHDHISEMISTGLLDLYAKIAATGMHPNDFDFTIEPNNHPVKLAQNTYEVTFAATPKDRSKRRVCNKCHQKWTPRGLRSEDDERQTCNFCGHPQSAGIYIS